MMATGLPGDSQLSLDILMAGLRAGVKRGEHSLVWAVMCGLRRGAQHPKNRKHLVLQGSVPLVKRTIDFYEAADASLPKPVPRPTAKALTFQDHPPAFLNKSKSQALLRYSGSVKDYWVGSSVSLPALPSATPLGKGRREPVDWFAGSPTAIASRVDTRGRVLVRSSKQTAADWCVGTPATNPGLRATTGMLGRPQPPVLDPLPSTTAAMASKRHQAEGAPASHSDVKKLLLGGQDFSQFPSLMWLISEDGVDEQAFYRCCDKGMVVLQARWLLRELENARDARDGTHQPKTQTIEVRRNPVWDYAQKV